MAEGLTEPLHDLTISSPVPGIVSAWKFKEGDFVKENETIVELDKRLEELEVARRKLVMESRKTDLDAVQALLEKNSISVRKEEVEKAQTEYKVACVEYEIAVEQLRKRSISSPFAGIIAEIVPDPGEACQANQPIIRVVDTRRCYLVCNVESKLAGRLAQGQKLRVSVDTASGTVDFQGQVVFLSPVVDTASGLQKVKVLFENVDGKIRPGITGRMYFD